MKSTTADIRSLLGLPKAMKEFENCVLKKSLGSTSECYLCRKYNVETLQFRDCNTNFCTCSDFKSKNDLIRHYVEKIIDLIDISFAEETVYIVGIGIKHRDNFSFKFHQRTAVLYVELLSRNSNELPNKLEIDDQRSELKQNLCLHFECADQTRPYSLSAV